MRRRHRSASSPTRISTGRATSRSASRGHRPSSTSSMCVATPSHPSAGVQYPGTYRGLIEKIPHLKDLGITAVELMPIQEFNEHDVSRADPTTGEPLKNTGATIRLAFSRPRLRMPASARTARRSWSSRRWSGPSTARASKSFSMWSSTTQCEGDELGPTVVFRGIDNAIYYRLDDDKRFYRDFTGCGKHVKRRIRSSAI